MTGLWQVLGRSDIPFEEMVRLDYIYVTNWSLWHDMRLMCGTVPAMLRGGRGRVLTRNVRRDPIPTLRAFDDLEMIGNCVSTVDLDGLGNNDLRGSVLTEGITACMT